MSRTPNNATDDKPIKRPGILSQIELSGDLLERYEAIRNLAVQAHPDPLFDITVKSDKGYERMCMPLDVAIANHKNLSVAFVPTAPLPFLFAALALNEISFEEDEAVISLDECLFSSDQFSKELNDLRKHFKIIYAFGSDGTHLKKRPQTASSFSSRSMSTNRPSPRYYYDRTAPKDYVMLTLRDKLIRKITNVFSETFIAPYDKNENRTFPQIAKNKVFNLLNAMSLGYIVFPTRFFDRYSCETWRRQALKIIEFDDIGEDDPDVSKAKKMISIAKDLIRIWDEKSKDCRFAMRIDRHELTNKELLNTVFSQYGEMIGANSAIKTLIAGVPVRDILA